VAVRDGAWLGAWLAERDSHQRVPGSVPGTSIEQRVRLTVRAGAWLGAWLAEYDGHQPSTPTTR